MAIVGDLVANLTADIRGFTGPLKVAAGLLAGFSVASFAADSLAGMRRQIQAEQKAESVIRSTGAAAGFTSGELKQMADDLELVTNFAGDVTLSAAAVLATFTQIKGDAFKGALVAAQDLSAVMGQDLQSSVVQIGKALNDPIKGVTALQRVGVSFTQTQKEQIKAMQESGNLAGAQALILKELQTEFGGAARAMADPMIQIWNVVGRVTDALWSMLLPAVNVVLNELMAMIAPIDNVAGSFEYVGAMVAEYVVGSIAFLKDAIVVVGFVIENFGSIAQLAFMEAQLAGVTFVNTLGHFFTATLPGWFNWFSENWADVFYTAFDLASTVFINLGQNIRTNMQAIWDYIASGGTASLELAWEPLTKGFVNTIKSMPEIADRIPSELEKSLTSDTASLRNKLAEDLGQTMLDATTDATQAVKPELPTFKGGSTDATLGGGKAVDVKAVGAAEAGSKEALSAIFASMRGDDAQKQLVRLQEEANRLAEEQVQATRDLMDSDEVVTI